MTKDESRNEASLPLYSAATYTLLTPYLSNPLLSLLLTPYSLRMQLLTPYLSLAPYSPVLIGLNTLLGPLLLDCRDTNPLIRSSKDPTQSVKGVNCEPKS